MNSFDPHCYTITIKLVSLEEGPHFEAVVAELPDLVEYGETFDQAYALAVDSIRMLRDSAMEQGRSFPEPLRSQAMDEFSGRVTLRMSKPLHATVSGLADRDGVSLNSWIIEAISSRAGAESFLHLGTSSAPTRQIHQTSSIKNFQLYTKMLSASSLELHAPPTHGLPFKAYIISGETPTSSRVSTMDSTRRLGFQ